MVRENPTSGCLLLAYGGAPAVYWMLPLCVKEMMIEPSRCLVLLTASENDLHCKPPSKPPGGFALPPSWPLRKLSCFHCRVTTESGVYRWISCPRVADITERRFIQVPGGIPYNNLVSSDLSKLKGVLFISSDHFNTRR